MSAKKDRKNSLRGWQLPECGQWVRITEFDPAVDGDLRSGYGCRVRATHTVTYTDATYTDADRVRTEYSCQAHLGGVLDWAASRRQWQRWSAGVDLPTSVVTELTFTTDPHAAAYGRRRFIRSERIITGAVEQALIVTQAAIPPAPPRRDRTPRRRAESTNPAAVQATLF